MSMPQRFYDFDDLHFSSLKDLRILRILTQDDLARAVGVCLDTVNNWETGRRKPQMRHWKRLARVLGIPVRLLCELLDLGPSRPSEEDAA